MLIPLNKCEVKLNFQVDFGSICLLQVCTILALSLKLTECVNLVLRVVRKEQENLLEVFVFGSVYC